LEIDIMTTTVYQIRASYAFVERNLNLIKRYWTWEIVWLVYSIAESMSVSFIGLGAGQVGNQPAQIDSRYLMLYLLIGTLVWRYLSTIFYWITSLIGVERWEGTIEYTLMAPIHRITHMAGQTIFSVGYSMFLTAVILAATALMFKIDLVNANLVGGALVLLAGSLSFIGIGVMASVMPLLFPERGEQMTHVFIALVLLVSGVYYPIDVLPVILQKIAIFSPATYVLDGVRKAVLQGLPTPQLWADIWPALLMGLALIPAGMWVFRQAELYAKRTGKLHRNG
jgi:ABC-2 type transport system permease protein